MHPINMLLHAQEESKKGGTICERLERSILCNIAFIDKKHVVCASSLGAKRKKVLPPVRIGVSFV